MQVRMLCDWPVALDGFNVTTLKTGETYQVAEDLGESLIRNEKASPVGEAKAETAPVEDKDAGAAPENKTAAKPRRRAAAKPKAAE